MHKSVQLHLQYVLWLPLSERMDGWQIVQGGCDMYTVGFAWVFIAWCSTQAHVSLSM